MPDHLDFLRRGLSLHALTCEAALIAVNSAVLNLYGVTVDYNGATGPSQGERGGINYITTSSGVCQDCVCQNNTGEGFNCQTSGSVTVTNLISGTDEGNTLADVAC